MCSNRLAIRTKREESARTRSSDRVIGFMIAVGKAVKPAMPKGAIWLYPKWCWPPSILIRTKVVRWVGFNLGQSFSRSAHGR